MHSIHRHPRLSSRVSQQTRRDSLHPTDQHLFGEFILTDAMSSCFTAAFPQPLSIQHPTSNISHVTFDTGHPTYIQDETFDIKHSTLNTQHVHDIRNSNAHHSSFVAHQGRADTQIEYNSHSVASLCNVHCTISRAGIYCPARGPPTTLHP